MLGGLDTPTKGSVTLAGKDLYRMKKDALAVFRRRKIGLVFQAFNLVSSVNVWENIVSFLTVALALRKPMKIVSRISPIEATLYLENAETQKKENEMAEKMSPCFLWQWQI